MIVDYLHAYYTMPARLWVGGVERTVTLRWFRAPPGAKKLPFPTCFFTHVDDKVWERNPGEPGELNRSRIHDQGRNNGYQGQCYLGDPQWFLTGQLPAAVLNPPAPSACLCQIKPGQAAGAIVLGGAARALSVCHLCPGLAPGGESCAFKVSIAGATGQFAPFNGSWILTEHSSCEWFAPVPNLVLKLNVNYPPIAWRLLASDTPGTFQAQWFPTAGGFDPYFGGTVTGGVVAGTGTVPATLTVSS